MAAKGYIGNSNNLSRKFKKAYIGNSSDLSIKAKKAYIGNSNDESVLLWSGQIEAGYIAFTTSQVWTAPETMYIDIFCYGGGGGGTLGNGPGAGAGYTKTVLNYRVTKGTSYAVIIGAGGLSRSNGNGTPTCGGASSFGDICLAYGGYAAVKSDNGSGVERTSCGGSGGGQQYGGLGGTDGGDGQQGTNPNDFVMSTMCKGQGTTTRAFGESSGTLYCTGGDSHADNTLTTYPTAGNNNTGDGGDSGTYNGVHGGNGGSGGVIIRWSTQEV